MVKPFYAGALYEKGYVPLLDQIQKCYVHRLGPGALPSRRKEQKISAVVVPQSPYSLSGPCAAWAYKVLAEHHFPGTYVLLVPDMRGVFVNYVTLAEDFDTVFGVCSVDKAFVQALLDTGIVSQTRNIQEFALEVQLPFLQQACRDRLRDLKIVPLIVPHSHNVQRLAEELVRIQRDIVLILVSDFISFGEPFFSAPFHDKIEESLHGQDMTLVRYLLDLDSDGFLRYVKKNSILLPGRHALVLGLEILKQLGVKEGELLHYSRSSEMTGKKQGSIGYVAMVF